MTALSFTRQIIRDTNRIARAEGLPLQTAYRWLNDGFIQRAFFTPPEAREHAEWCKVNSQSVKVLYHRELLTGRFCRA